MPIEVIVCLGSSVLASKISPRGHQQSSKSLPGVPIGAQAAFGTSRRCRELVCWKVRAEVPRRLHSSPKGAAGITNGFSTSTGLSQKSRDNYPTISSARYPSFSNRFSKSWVIPGHLRRITFHLAAGTNILMSGEALVLLS